MSPTVLNDLPDLKGMTYDELAAYADKLDEPAFRARQWMEWMYEHGEHRFDHMTSLPKRLRLRLLAEARVTHLDIADLQTSNDGTRKYLFRLADGNTVESVLIPEGRRWTLCISSQAGCGMDCRFCATGLGGLVRNLKAGEIVDQVIRAQQESGRRVTNVVFMGMGEPLANVREVTRAIRLLNDPLGLGLGARRITVSTCGIVPGIRRLMEERLQIVLAVSLHGVNDEQRSRIMPINKKFPIGELLDACRAYAHKTRRRISFEYILLSEVNDAVSDAHALARLLDGLPCHVNLIPFNPVPETPFRRPTSERVAAFRNALVGDGVEATVRVERGADIEAACGQLRRQREIGVPRPHMRAEVAEAP